MQPCTTVYITYAVHVHTVTTKISKKIVRKIFDFFFFNFGPQLPSSKIDGAWRMAHGAWRMAHGPAPFFPIPTVLPFNLFIKKTFNNPP